MVDWGDEPHPIEALREMAELLAMVAYWRERYERLSDEKDHRIKRWRKNRAAQHRDSA